MLKSCLLGLAFWLAVSAGYWYWLDHVFEPPGSILGALGVGLVASGCLGTLYNARTAFQDWSLLTASREGSRPADGKLAAFSGTMHPVGQPLIAPFSGRECVLCEYDLSRHPAGSSREEGNTGVDYAGFLMTPCAIRGEYGDVRIFGFPILEEGKGSVCHGFDAANNALQFLKTTEFENRTGLKMATLLSVFGDVWSDDDGLVDKNFCLRKVVPDELFPPELLDALREEEPDSGLNFAAEAGENALDFEDDSGHAIDGQDSEDAEFESEIRPLTRMPKLVEKRIEVGDLVCVFGRYNEMRRGLLPLPGTTQPNRLIRGGVDKVARQSRRSFVNRLLGGVITLILLNAVVFGVTQAYLYSPDTISRRQREAVQAVHQGDSAGLRELLRRGLDPNTRDGNGRSLLDLATQLGNREVIELLQSAGADR